ncbi:MAG: acyltransferase family protein [Corynebacterium sp.]|nr:acyltransferase family protein [Corynebacterium sp.]
MRTPWALLRRLRTGLAPASAGPAGTPTSPAPTGASASVDELLAQRRELERRRDQLQRDLAAITASLAQVDRDLAVATPPADKASASLRAPRRWPASVRQRTHRALPESQRPAHTWAATAPVRSHAEAPEPELRTRLTRARRGKLGAAGASAEVTDVAAAADTAAAPTASEIITARTPHEVGTRGRRAGKATLRQVPGIDGLRGIAVAAVVIYHFFGNVLPGGFMGVDMFFILSGFLITSLLVREHAVTGAVNLKNFWLRRVRRILPAAATVLLICTAIVGTMGGDTAVQLPAQFFGSLFFVNNWVQIAGSSSYFADSGVEVFAHYWSLAVEEQFYVLWPLIFIGLAALGMKVAGPGGRRQRLPLLVCALIAGVASAALMGWLYDPQVDPTRVYYGSDTHAFGLLTGVIVALLWGSRSPQAQADSWPVARWSGAARTGVAVASTLALIGILALFVTTADTAAVTYPWALAGAGILTAIALVGVVAEVGPVSWLARTLPLRWLGQRSFSLYLWHWPVIIIIEELLRPASSTWVPGVLALVISLPLSELSYRFVENPFRRRGYKATLGWLFAARPHLALPRIAVGLATVAALILASIGMVKAPPMTQLEAQLAAAAELQEEANRLAQEAAEVHQREVDSREVPTGPEITAIGDSVLLGAAPAMYQQLPGIYVDGEVSRHYTAVAGIVAALKAQDQLRQFVVLSFGTNGQAFPGQLEEILSAIGPDRIVALVSPYGDRYWMAEARQQVIAAVENNANVYGADWCSRALADPTLVGADGIHPSATGIDAYIASIMDAFTQWSNDEKVVPAVCG